MVLLHNGGFFNTCTIKRCLHRKVDSKTNALNNAHISQLFHYKSRLLQNDGIIVSLLIKTNSFQMDTSHRKKLAKFPQRLHFPIYINKIIQKRISLLLLNVNLMKYGPTKVYL
jgi:hypothetical protein